MIAPFPWDKIGIIVGAGAFAVVLLCLVSRLIDRGEHSAPRTRWRDAFGDLPVTLRDLADDDGRDIADLFADDDDDGDLMIDPDCRDGKHQSCVGDPCDCTCHLDVPGAGLPREGSMASPQELAGSGYFHDDVPTAAIPSVRVQGVYLPLSDDTVTDITPYPRGGAAAWQTARPNPRVPARDSRPEWVWCGGTWTRLGAAGVPWLDTLFTAPLRILEAA